MYLCIQPSNCHLKQDPKHVHELSLSNDGKRARVLVFTFVAHYWNLRLGTFDFMPAFTGQMGKLRLGAGSPGRGGNMLYTS